MAGPQPERPRPPGPPIWPGRDPRGPGLVAGQAGGPGRGTAGRAQHARVHGEARWPASIGGGRRRKRGAGRARGEGNSPSRHWGCSSTVGVVGGGGIDPGGRCGRVDDDGHARVGVGRPDPIPPVGRERTPTRSSWWCSICSGTTPGDGTVRGGGGDSEEQQRGREESSRRRARGGNGARGRWGCGWGGHHVHGAGTRGRHAGMGRRHGASAPALWRRRGNSRGPPGRFKRNYKKVLSWF